MAALEDSWPGGLYLSLTIRAQRTHTETDFCAAQVASEVGSVGVQRAPFSLSPRSGALVFAGRISVNFLGPA